MWYYKFTFGDLTSPRLDWPRVVLLANYPITILRVDVSLLSHAVGLKTVVLPLLFIVYTVDLADIVDQHGVFLHVFADDTQMYLQSSREPAVCCHSAGTVFPRLASGWPSVASNSMCRKELSTNSASQCTAACKANHRGTSQISVYQCPTSQQGSIFDLLIGVYWWLGDGGSAHSVHGPSLWPDRRFRTLYHTAWEIRILAGTTSDVCWRRIYFHCTEAFSVLEMFEDDTLYKLTYLLTYFNAFANVLVISAIWVEIALIIVNFIPYEKPLKPTC